MPFPWRSALCRGDSGEADVIYVGYCSMVVECVRKR